MRARLFLPVLVAVLPLGGPTANAQEAPLCSVSTPPSGTLAAAKALYAQSCPGLARRDCDPAADGAWMCSSGVIGVAAADGSRAPDAPPVLVAEPAPRPDPVLPPAPTQPTDGSVCAVETGSGGSLGEAVGLYQRRCAGIARLDCDPLPNGGWSCSSGVIGAGAPGGSARAPSPTVPPAPRPAPPAPPAPEPAPPPPAPEPPPPVTAPAPSGSGGVGRLGGGDLLSLHYDNCPDTDDGHAMAAGFSLTQTLGITPLVVNGTCGDPRRGQYKRQSQSVVDASFGSALNAETDRSGAVSSATDAFAGVLANGADVWIAEGGPSDFTADVLRLLASRYPGLDRRRIHVVQHSTWNERNTESRDLRFVRSVTDYIRLEDGNHTNATANLNQRSSSFVSRARSSRYNNAWNAAFVYLNPNVRLDFSDTVELLYIIGDGATRNPDDFAGRYLR